MNVSLSLSVDGVFKSNGMVIILGNFIYLYNKKNCISFYICVIDLHTLSYTYYLLVFCIKIYCLHFLYAFQLKHLIVGNN